MKTNAINYQLKYIHRNGFRNDTFSENNERWQNLRDAFNKSGEEGEINENQWLESI